MADLTPVLFTPEQLDELANITDADIAIAAAEIARLLSPEYRNLLLALPENIANAATNQP